MIDKEKVKNGIINMLKVNMGLKDGEKLLIVTDFPAEKDWLERDSAALTDFVTRSILARMVYEIAKEEFPNCTIDFHVYPATGRHGAEPPEETAKKLKEYDVVIAITTFSITHTKARKEATDAGVRIASMPMFLPEMFYPEGPMGADYTKISEETEKIAKLLTEAKEAVIKSPGGTDIKLSLEGREAHADTGLLTKKGAVGNLPAGEAYIAPLEGTAEGKVVVEAGWFPGLEENMTLVFKNGEVTEVIGGGKVGDKFRDLLRPGVDEEPYKSRRNLAELGIGTNPNAKRPDNVLEAEKIKGTVHIAIGDNSTFGGKVSTDLHQDFIIPKPTLYLDGKLVMKDGEFVV